MRNERLPYARAAVASIGLAASLALFAGQAWSMQNLDGQALRERVAGNTFSGHLNDGTPYRIFYDLSGTARAKSGHGSWTVKGKQLCAAFDDDEKLCLSGSLTDDQIWWVSPHGELEGTGKILKGNPFKY